METVITYTDETAYISTDERKTINRLRKLTADHPEQVRVIAEPENNDGCLYMAVPSKWVRISPPRKLELTDEERAEIGNRLSKQRMDREKSAKEVDEPDESE